MPTGPARGFSRWAGSKMEVTRACAAPSAAARLSPESSSRSAYRTVGQGPVSMQRNFVLTLTGPDRIGVVETVTRLLLERGGNVETSRMARLGGEFAILMLVSVPSEQLTSID